MILGRLFAWSMIVFSILLLAGCGFEPYKPGSLDTISEADVKVEGMSILNISPETDIKLKSEDSQKDKEESSEAVNELEKRPAEPASEDSVIIFAEETEAINLRPEGEDPDDDKLTYTFSSPLNQNGAWKTTYGNAGEYRVTVTASDGTLSTSKDVLIIVNKKEEAPRIDKAAPEEAALKAKENSKLAFSIEASDLNKDALSYIWKLDGKDVSTKQSIVYDIGYEDAGSHTVKAEVNDGTSTASRLWAVTVENLNRVPKTAAIADGNAKETETVTISISADDDDKDSLSYAISDTTKFKQDENMFTWQTTYEDAGDYVFNVLVSDGTDQVIEKAKVHVENVNRAPVIKSIKQVK